ncbi:protection of telomeres protein 1 [Entomortierella parvispora]|uniref:Protection of telomeres protein 1 n=1 Tax=Entomortierella parvispora TaxID=205924 RepID=A0A9P3LSL5_9FUNG|nr:protection of telomeres protein 1 [Entomortierella parvispora]
MDIPEGQVSYLSGNIPPAPTSKLSTVHHLRENVFCDLVAEVCSIFDSDKNMVLTVTDYTEHEKLPYYNEGDNRPIGKASLLITLWDEHHHAARSMGIQAGHIVYLKNLVCRVTGGRIELAMRGYRGYGFKQLNPISLLSKDDDLARALTARKSRYVRDVQRSTRGAGLEPIHAEPATMAKQEPPQDEPPQPQRQPPRQLEQPPRQLEQPQSQQQPLVKQPVLQPLLQQLAQPLLPPPFSQQPLSQQPFTQQPDSQIFSQPFSQLPLSQLPAFQQPLSQQPAPQQPPLQQEEIKEERLTPRLATPVRDIRDPSPMAGSLGSTRVFTEQIKQEVARNKNAGKDNGHVLVPANVRVISYHPKDIRNFTIRICANCRHNYGGDKAGPICPTCNRRDILDYEYLFELGLEDEFGQQYAATVDNASAKTLLKTLNAGNLYKKHELRDKLLQCFALIGVIKGSQEEQARSTTFFRCCLRLDNDKQSTVSQYDAHTILDKTALSRSGYLSQEEESGQEVLRSSNSTGAALKRKAAEESHQSAKKRLHLEQAIPCKLVYTAIN